VTDPYRISGTDEREHRTGGMLRPVLWGLLMISLGLNVALSTVDTFLGVAFGLVALASVAGLITHHYRHRRR
jgi:hypothetical protein